MYLILPTTLVCILFLPAIPLPFNSFLPVLFYTAIPTLFTFQLFFLPVLFYTAIPTSAINYIQLFFYPCDN